MNTYTAYQSAAQTRRSVFSARRKISLKGHSGSVARLVVMGILAIIAFLSSFGTIGQYVPKVGLGQAIVDAIGGCGLLLMLGAWFWCIMKWVGFIAPKSFRAANAFWRSWIPLTFLGLYLKACGWIMILLLPISAGMASYWPYFSFAMAFGKSDVNFFSALVVLLLGIVSVAIPSFLDICKIRGLAPMAVIRQKLAQFKH